ncbi:MAG TPA: hypothetical protein PKJ24_09860 [Prolixibacteraceae bacterium]|nr:hypothetical protein [Prolixibacteraceae bacterium]HPT30520.1 hypothetical protein [Prolixibacteraceae bacterium]
MIGIPDPAIWIGYVLAILSVIACIVYSVKNWNKSDDPAPDAPEREINWEKEEDKINEML